jgi:hypothetical protein
MKEVKKVKQSRYAMEALWGRGCIALTHHDLGTRWR